MTRLARSAHRTSPVLRGAFTALVTPFTADGTLDEAAYRRLVAWQVMAGIDGLVPVGTTGESPTLTAAERDRCIEIAVTTAAERSARAAPSRSSPGRARTTPARRSRPPAGPPRWAPTRRSSSPRTTTSPTSGCSRPTSAPSRTRAACRSWSTTCPGRTGANVEADTFLRLAEHPRVIAVKEASANIEQLAVICRDRPRDVAVLSGDDAATLAILAMGGDGVISVASNEIPGEMTAAGRALARRRPARGAPAPRAVPAADAGQLPGRPQPGAREGRDARHGPDRRRHAAAAAPAARRRAARAARRAPAGPRARRRRGSRAARCHDRRPRRPRDRRPGATIGVEVAA